MSKLPTKIVEIIFQTKANFKAWNIPKPQPSHSPSHPKSGSTISTLLHDKINPKDCQVLSLGDSGFLQFLGLFQVIMANPRKLIPDLPHRFSF